MEKKKEKQVWIPTLLGMPADILVHISDYLDKLTIMLRRDALNINPDAPCSSWFDTMEGKDVILIGGISATWLNLMLTCKRFKNTLQKRFVERQGLFNVVVYYHDPPLKYKRNLTEAVRLEIIKMYTDDANGFMTEYDRELLTTRCSILLNHTVTGETSIKKLLASSFLIVNDTGRDDIYVKYNNMGLLDSDETKSILLDLLKKPTNRDMECTREINGVMSLALNLLTLKCFKEIVKAHPKLRINSTLMQGLFNALCTDRSDEMADIIDYILDEKLCSDMMDVLHTVFSPSVDEAAILSTKMEDTVAESPICRRDALLKRIVAESDLVRYFRYYFSCTDKSDRLEKILKCVRDDPEYIHDILKMDSIWKDAELPIELFVCTIILTLYKTRENTKTVDHIIENIHEYIEIIYVGFVNNNRLYSNKHVDIIKRDILVSAFTSSANAEDETGVGRVDMGLYVKLRKRFRMDPFRDLPLPDGIPDESRRPVGHDISLISFSILKRHDEEVEVILRAMICEDYELSFEFFISLLNYLFTIQVSKNNVGIRYETRTTTIYKAEGRKREVEGRKSKVSTAISAVFKIITEITLGGTKNKEVANRVISMFFCTNGEITKTDAYHVSNSMNLILTGLGTGLPSWHTIGRINPRKK